MPAAIRSAKVLPISRNENGEERRVANNFQVVMVTFCNTVV